MKFPIVGSFGGKVYFMNPPVGANAQQSLLPWGCILFLSNRRFSHCLDPSSSLLPSSPPFFFFHPPSSSHGVIQWQISVVNLSAYGFTVVSTPWTPICAVCGGTRLTSFSACAKDKRYDCLNCNSAALTCCAHAAGSALQSTSACVVFCYENLLLGLSAMAVWEKILFICASSKQASRQTNQQGVQPESVL